MTSASEAEAQRQARIDEANRQNEIERLERVRKEREGEVHFVTRVVVERVNVFPPKPTTRSTDLPGNPVRKVTRIDSIDLNGKELADLIQRVRSRLSLVHDDGIIDPVRPTSTRRSAPIGEDFDD